MKTFFCIFAFVFFFITVSLCVAPTQDVTDSISVCNEASLWRVGGIMTEEQLEAAPADSLFSVSPIPDDVFRRMQGKSFPQGCTITRGQLRYIRLLHYDFEGNVRCGELVCHQTIASSLKKIFEQLYAARYPIHSVRLIDDFDADDERSMRANNTSCFCFRKVAGSKVLSKHSRGLAIDINPLQNPCVRKNSKGVVTIQPSNAREYVNRSKKFRGRISPEDLCYRLFRDAGFRWGGNWRTVKDYQHFEK